MKTVRLAVATAVVALLALMAPSPVQAYPALTVTVSESTVTGGDDITITAVVSPAVDCESWSLTFLGDTRTGSGSSITETFDTPEVDETEHHDAVATCTWDDPHPGPQDEAAPSVTGSGSVGSLGTAVGASLVTELVTATGTGTQTLLPLDGGDDDDDGNGGGDGDGGGILPNTGGERLAWLVIGAMLVLVGGGVVLASRRRDADA